MTRVVGIDLSMTATGIAVIDGPDVFTYVIKSKPDDGTLEGFINRSQAIADSISAYVSLHSLVLIEGMSFGSKSRSLDKIHGNWWMVVKSLTGHLMQEPVVIAPSTRAKYATGKGNASKEAVLLAVERRYPGGLVADNNAADALVLAAMGARWQGNPIEESLPLVNLEAMEKVAWPARTEVRIYLAEETVTK